MGKKNNPRIERQMRRNRMFISIFLSALMILSIAGIIASNLGDDDSHRREDITYNSEMRQWQYVNDGELYFFYNLPEDVLQVPHNASIIETIRGTNGLILLFDPLSSQDTLKFLDLIRFDFAQTWVEKMDQPLGYGLLQNDTTGTYTFPVVDCGLADSQNIAISFIEDNTTHIETGSSPYCIMMYGHDQDFGLLRDFILYAYLGVI